jgi:predicted nucleic acid-binding protein
MPTIDGCTDLLEGHPGPLLVPSPVVAEVCYMVESRVGSAAEAQFLRSLASGELELAELTRSDLARMAEMVKRYADLPLGAADASVIAIAERLANAGMRRTVLPNRLSAVTAPHGAAKTPGPATPQG